MEIHIAENHHEAQQTKRYDASQLSTAHPRGPWRSNHMHHLCRRDFFASTWAGDALLKPNWKLPHFFIIFPPTISGQSRNRQRQGRRCNCTTSNVATEDEWMHCPRVGSQLPRSWPYHIYHHLLTISPTQQSSPGSPGNCGLKDIWIPIFPQPRNRKTKDVSYRHWNAEAHRKAWL